MHVNKDVRKLRLQTCLPFFSIALKTTFTQQHWVYQYQGQDSRKFHFVRQNLYPNNSTNINDACDFKSLRGKNALARHFEMILYNKTRDCLSPAENPGKAYRRGDCRRHNEHRKFIDRDSDVFLGILT